MSVTEFPRTRGGLRLGPEVNDFNDVDQATTEAARDAYFAGNPANLTVYDQNSNLLIRLTYLVGVDLVTRFQVRLAGDWVDYTPVVQGPPGEVASLAGVQVGEIPYKLINGTFGGSNMRVLGDGSILAPPGFTVESGSITFGEALTLSEVSGFLGISNHINGNLYTVVDFFTPPTAASSEPHIFYLTGAATEFVAQAVDTTNIPDNPLIFNYTVQNTARSHSLKFRTYAPMSNVRAKISLISNGVALKYFPNRQAWEEEFGGLNWGTGDNVVPFGDTPLNLEAGMLIKIEIYADVIALKGNASNIPYFSAMLQQGTFIDVITENSYTAVDVKSKLESLSSPNKLTKTAIQDVVNTVNGSFGEVVITKTSLGLGNVDNTSDVNKPVSTAQQTAINLSITNHTAAVDPHTQYTTVAEASAAAPVQSVNAKSGAVVLFTEDIVEVTNLYYTGARVGTYLVNNGYNVKSVASSGVGSSIFNANTAGAVTLRSIIGTGSVSVTQNANDITITAPILTGGTYTPTLTMVNNLLATTAFQCQYMRVDGVVTVSGKINMDVNSNGQICRLGISLPVASDFGAEEDLGGTASSMDIQQNSGIKADITNNRAALEFLANSNTTRDWFFTFTYRIV